MSESVPSKLSKLKKWLMLPETAKHLSDNCGEEFTEADILQHALDGHLNISVFFKECVLAKPGLLEENHDRKQILESLKKVEPITGKHFVRNFMEIVPKKYPKLEDKVITIKGIFDLPMIGQERSLIEDEYNILDNCPLESPHCIEGVYVERDGIIYKLQEHLERVWHNETTDGMNSIQEHQQLELSIDPLGLDECDWKPQFTDSYYPAYRLPHCGVLVVKTEVLSQFIEKFNKSDSEQKNNTKPHGNTLNNVRDRENILGAAFAMVATNPGDFRKKSGDINVSELARQLALNQRTLFPDGNMHMTEETASGHLSNCINKTKKPK